MAERKKSVSFKVSGSSTSQEGLRMDPQLAERLLESGATLVLLDFPVGSEFGIDLNSWNTGQKFKGVKMIPPGKHFIYWSTVSKEGQVAPRTGFFHDFKQGELLAKRYESAEEDVVIVDPDTVERLRADLRGLDPHLGPYPYDSWKKWISLTNRISDATISRLEPMNGKIQSVTELVPEKHFTSRRQPSTAAQVASGSTTSPEENAAANPQGKPSPTATLAEGSRGVLDGVDEEKLPKMRHKPGTEIRYTPLPTQKYPAGSTPEEVTRHSMDSSYQLKTYLGAFRKMYSDQVSSSMAHVNQCDEVLAELQFSFICFLVGQHYDSFEHWKRLLALFCSCDDAIAENSQLYLALISDMHFQIREVPDDFFVDIVSNNNFLVTILTQLFQSINSSPDICLPLKERAAMFQANLSRKFEWDFDMEAQDDAPVVVNLDENSES